MRSRFNFSPFMLCMAVEQLGTGNAGLGTTEGNTIPGNLKVGASGTNLLGVYGTAPVAQRASSTQATSVVSGISTGAVSTNSLVLASLLEIMNTLAGIGIWKGGA